MSVSLEEQFSTFVDHVFWNDYEEDTVPIEERVPGRELEWLKKLPLAVQIIQTLCALCYVPNFTIVPPVTDRIEHGVFLGKLWTSDPDTNKGYMEENRQEVLRCLLMCFSGSVFIDTDLYTHGTNKWMTEMVSERNPWALTVFYSLLNTICSYDPSSYIPYSHTLFSDHKKGLVDIAIQIIVPLIDHKDINDHALIDRHRPTQVLDENGQPISGVSIEPQTSISVPNLFRKCMLAITSVEDMHVVFIGLTTILNYSYEAVDSTLPYSYKNVDNFEEVTVLLWKLLDENKSFRDYVLQQQDILLIIRPLLYFMYLYKSDASKLGLLLASSFILLLLSGDRNFSVALNKPYNYPLPLSDLPKFKGTYGDLLIITVQKVIVLCPTSIDQMITVLLTVLSNVSPYLTHSCSLTGVKILSLFELFSTPRFLYANATNHKYVFYLIDVFCNIIQYQFSGNAAIIYAILVRSRLFLQLARMPGQAVTDETDSYPLPLESEIERDGSGRFVATCEWAASWKRKLPLEPVLKMIDFLLPKVNALRDSLDGGGSEDDFHLMLKETTLVGILPLPHSICIRNYIPNRFTNMWFVTYFWGLVFLRNQEFPLFDGSKVKMFVVSGIDNETESKQDTPQDSVPSDALPSPPPASIPPPASSSSSSSSSASSSTRPRPPPPSTPPPPKTENNSNTTTATVQVVEEQEEKKEEHSNPPAVSSQEE